MILKEGLGVDIISVENREVKAVKPEKWISVESQPKQMPITTMENITLTDTREIESSLIGGEMAKKIKKMLTQQQQIENFQLQLHLGCAICKVYKLRSE